MRVPCTFFYVLQDVANLCKTVLIAFSRCHPVGGPAAASTTTPRSAPYQGRLNPCRIYETEHLGFHNFTSPIFDKSSSITCVNYELRVLNYPVVVIIAVICGYKDGVISF